MYVDVKARHVRPAALCGLILLLLVRQTTYAQQVVAKLWTLDECIRQALKENIALNQDALSNEINLVNYQQAKANQLPSLNASTNYTLSNGRSYNQSISQFSSELASGVNIGATGSIVLFNGARNVNLIRENKLFWEAGKLDVQKMRNDLMLSVVAAYLQMLFEYEAIEIATTIIENDKQHVLYTEKYVKAGSQPESNLLQVQAQLETDNANKVAAESRLRIARVNLMQLMEIPAGQAFDIEHPQMQELSLLPTQEAEDIYHTALSILPEVRSAVTKTQASAIGLKVSRAALLPKLALSGNLSSSYWSLNSLVAHYQSSSVRNIGYVQNNETLPVYGTVTTTSTELSTYPFWRQLGDNFGQSFSLNLSIPIFNNLIYKSEVARSRIAFRIAQLNESLVKNQVRKGVEQAYTDQLNAGKQLIATQKQLTAEQRSYHDAEVKFKAGIMNATDLFVEKGNYNKAMLSHLSAKYEYLFKTKVLSFYSGDLITP